MICFFFPFSRRISLSLSLSFAQLMVIISETLLHFFFDRYSGVNRTNKVREFSEGAHDHEATAEILETRHRREEDGPSRR